MDNNSKTWRWRKKSAEKSQNINEIQSLLAEKAELEKDLKTLEGKLAPAFSGCSAKDELSKKRAEMAQESARSWDREEEEEEERVSLKLLLDEALQQRLAGEERLTHLSSALEECKRQLGLDREENEQRSRDAVAKASKEFEKSRMVLEEKLVEANKRLSKMATDNANLEKAIVLKEKLVEELTRKLNQVEADFGGLMIRLEATEKDNTSFEYEVRVLEKELEIRNEEREFNRRSAEASHRQHLDYVKKIAKMELECQRLRTLVQKQLPGPAALVKMKSEVEVLGRDSDETRRKSNPTRLMLGSMGDHNSSETPIKAERLFAIEEENKALREELVRRTKELESVKKLSQVELQFDSSSKLARSSLMSQHEISLESASEIESDDKASCAESWASALISELENLRNEKCKGSSLRGGIGASDMSLMDDFVEMEKLAVISVDNEYSSGRSETEMATLSGSKLPIWLQDTVKSILVQNRVTGRSFREILEETRVALDHIECSKPGEHVSNNQVDLDRGKSIYKMIELIEGLGLAPPNKEGKHSTGDSQIPEGYVARVLQWKTSELITVVQRYVVACYDVLNGKANLDEFVQQLTIALEWIINHCFSLQDVSSMRDAIIKQCDWDDCDSDLGVGGITRCFSGSDISREHHAENVRKSKDELMNGEKKESQLKQKKFEESEKVIENMQKEMRALRNERATIEDLVERQKMMNENLDTQLSAARHELNETRQQFSSLEVELENKSNCFEELEATCVELQLQLESMKKGSPNASLDQKEKQLPTDQEITAASEKLAECQETILGIGKQLKALSTPRGVTPNEAKTIAEVTRPTTTIKKAKSMKPRKSLLDQMLADDGSRSTNPISPETTEIASKAIEPVEKILISGGKNVDDDDVAVEKMALVPTKKRGGGSLWKKLMWRKKKGGCYGKHTALSPAS